MLYSDEAEEIVEEVAVEEPAGDESQRGVQDD